MNSSESFLLMFALFGFLGWMTFRYFRRRYPTATLAAWFLSAFLLVWISGSSAAILSSLQAYLTYATIFLMGPMFPFLLKLSWNFSMAIFGLGDATSGMIMGFGDDHKRNSYDYDEEPARMPSLLFNRKKKD